MPDVPPLPDTCLSMEEVRAGVDALDAQLVEMLALRFAYMRAAARIKSDRGQVRDEGRKAQVIANAKERAQALGLPSEAVETLWHDLVETSIAYEMTHWDAQRAD
jgi:isochorismate pyruvate lyase